MEGREGRRKGWCKQSEGELKVIFFCCGCTHNDKETLKGE